MLIMQSQANTRKMTKLTVILLPIPTLEELALELKSIMKADKIMRNYQFHLK